MRIAFLSGFVLEFLATLSVALVAVGIGFRLLDGGMTLAAGLTVLIIVPEVYGPVRDVGVRFHDAQDGLAAIDAVFSLDDDPAPPSSVAMQGHAGDGIRVIFDGLTASGRDGDRPRDLTGVAEPGAVTVLAGENGSGKSTALLALLGIVPTATDPRPPSPDGAIGEDLWRGPLRPGARWRSSAMRRDCHSANAAVAVGASCGAGAAHPTSRPPTLTRQRCRDAALLREGERRATVLVASHDPLVLAAADAVIEVTP